MPTKTNMFLFDSDGAQLWCQREVLDKLHKSGCYANTVVANTLMYWVRKGRFPPYRPYGPLKMWRVADVLTWITETDERGYKMNATRSKETRYPPLDDDKC